MNARPRVPWNGIGWDGMGWDGMGWDENLQNRPIPCDEKL